MNILGIGGWEFVAILIIMLVVAGPERMVKWARIWGRYVAWAWGAWTDIMEQLQKELDDAGVDVQLPKKPPTRQSLNRAASDMVKPVLQPVQNAVDEVKAEMNQLKQQTTVEIETNGRNLEKEGANGQPDDDEAGANYGTWSGQADK